METTKKRKQSTVEKNFDDGVWRCDAAATVSKKVSVAKAKQEIRMKPNTRQGQHRRVTLNPTTMESEIKAQSRNLDWCRGACAHLRPNVHHISWIMSQHFCQEIPRHACKRRRRKWRLARPLCFLHQLLHRSPRSHHDWVHAHLTTGDPSRRIGTQQRDKQPAQLW